MTERISIQRAALEYGEAVTSGSQGSAKRHPWLTSIQSRFPLTSGEVPLPLQVQLRTSAARLNDGGSGTSPDHTETDFVPFQHQACAAARRRLAVGYNGFAVELRANIQFQVPESLR